MLQKVNRLLTILMFSLIGVYIGYCIYTYADYRARPGLYELYSAPWYTPILLCGACVLVRYWLSCSPQSSSSVICMPNVSVP